MSKRKDGQVRGKYTLEFKLEAVRLVKGGQPLVLTPRTSQASVTGQRALCSAIQAYFTVIPERSTPSLFLKYRAPCEAANFLHADALTPFARVTPACRQHL